MLKAPQSLDLRGRRTYLSGGAVRGFRKVSTGKVMFERRLEETMSPRGKWCGREDSTGKSGGGGGAGSA